jgi:hypothetical protein
VVQLGVLAETLKFNANTPKDNLRFALNSCIFGNSNLTRPIYRCSAEPICGHLQRALDDRMEDPTLADQYTYCSAYDNSFLSTSLALCEACLREANEAFLSNCTFQSRRPHTLTLIRRSSYCPPSRLHPTTSTWDTRWTRRNLVLTVARQYYVGHSSTWAPSASWDCTGNWSWHCIPVFDHNSCWLPKALWEKRSTLEAPTVESIL